jgi:hypothetical protein
MPDPHSDQSMVPASPLPPASLSLDPLSADSPVPELSRASSDSLAHDRLARATRSVAARGMVRGTG